MLAFGWFERNRTLSDDTAKSAFDPNGSADIDNIASAAASDNAIPVFDFGSASGALVVTPGLTVE